MSDLSASAIARWLQSLSQSARPCDRPLTVVAETASTNDDARAAAALGAPHGAAFVADAQTKGRGRGGHTWHSPPGENLYLSVVLRPQVPAASVAPIALAVGVVVARVVRSVVGDAAPIWVKWPNDVLAGPRPGKKLAGVLVEGQLRGAEVHSLVAGVGVNMHARSFPEEIAARATSLSLLGVEGFERSALAATLIHVIDNAVGRYELSRLATFKDDLDRFDALRGLPVEVGGVRGVASGIDEEGRLLVLRAGGIVPVASGEVSIG